MNATDRIVSAAAKAHHFIDDFAAPSVADLTERTSFRFPDVNAAPERLDGQYRLFVAPGNDTATMAHPFSDMSTDYQATIGGRRWSADCAWGASVILSMLGNGGARTRPPVGGIECS